MSCADPWLSFARVLRSGFLRALTSAATALTGDDRRVVGPPRGDAPAGMRAASQQGKLKPGKKINQNRKFAVLRGNAIKVEDLSLDSRS